MFTIFKFLKKFSIQYSLSKIGYFFYFGGLKIQKGYIGRVVSMYLKWIRKKIFTYKM